MIEETLHLLSDWYAAHCDGDWEHASRVEIRSLDNPGWSIKVDLADTYDENLMLKRIEVERTADDWYHCWLEGDVFHAAGGRQNLPDLIRSFADWIEKYEE